MTTTTTTTTARPPQVGQKAPDLTLPLAAGGTFTLSEAVKNGPVVVAFFPGAFTGTCTKEMCNFTDNWAQYETLGAQIIGVSVDSKHAQKAFTEKFNIKVPFATDFEKKIIQQWGLPWESSWGVTAKRATFVVDKTGTVRYANVQANASDEPNYAEIQKGLQDLK